MYNKQVSDCGIDHALSYGYNLSSAIINVYNTHITITTVSFFYPSCIYHI